MLSGGRVTLSSHYYCLDHVCSLWQLSDLSLPPLELRVGINDLTREAGGLNRSPAISVNKNGGRLETMPWHQHHTEGCQIDTPIQTNPKLI
jgi:hypothetical protein